MSEYFQEGADVQMPSKGNYMLIDPADNLPQNVSSFVVSIRC